MLLAFDLDNTVVTRGNEIPEAIVRAVAAARREGHLVTVLTGRPKASTVPLLDTLGVTGPYAVNHGAIVFGEDDAVLSRSLIAAPLVDRLVHRYGVDEGLEYAFMYDDDIYVRDPEDPRWSWAHTLNRNVLAFHKDRVRDADKIVFSADAAGPRMLAEIRDEHPELMRYLWPDGFLELTGPGAHKGAALAHICRVLGVAQRDTVAFGDGINDVTMLEWAGHAVAVGDAHPDVLAVADEHIEEPEALGVATWLETNLQLVPR
jgi:Cof subfamily protein (haloacid dehalogenase superfamily)